MESFPEDLLRSQSFSALFHLSEHFVRRHWWRLPRFRCGKFQNIVHLFSGNFNLKFDLKKLLPVIDGHNPAGTSVKTAAHFAQIYNADGILRKFVYLKISVYYWNLIFPILITGQTFQRYDFGPLENQIRYGQSTPPEYDLSKVTCPVILFWSQNDKVSLYNQQVLLIFNLYT